MDDLDRVRDFTAQHQERKSEYAHDMAGSLIIGLLVSWAWSAFARRPRPTHPLQQTYGSPTSTDDPWFGILVGLSVLLFILVLTIVLLVL